MRDMRQAMFILLLLLSVKQLSAQPLQQPRWFGRLDLYHQDVLDDISFGQLSVYDPVHIRPGFRVGVERTWIEKTHFRFFQDILVGGYFNPYDERSFTLGTDAGVEWRIFKQFRVAMPFGLQFHRVKPRDVRYVFDGEKWVRAPNTDPVIRRVQIPVGLNLGWRFWPTSPHPIEVFANGNVSLVRPYQPGSGIPFFMYKAAGLGVKIGI